MSTPINTPSSLLVAQMISQAKGQEAQSRLSDEKTERERQRNQLLQQAEEFQRTQNQAPGAQKGFLA